MFGWDVLFVLLLKRTKFVQTFHSLFKVKSLAACAEFSTSW